MEARDIGGWVPFKMERRCRQLGMRLTREVLWVRVRSQVMLWMAVRGGGRGWGWECECRAVFRISTSRFGVGQVKDSYRTPLGLHRVAEKVGGGWPVGAVFRDREFRGYVWGAGAGGTILHRILRLEGLEPGFNRGGNRDTWERCIYIHGTPDEGTLGRPASRGCIHLSASDLIPLYRAIPLGTLVWVSES